MKIAGLEASIKEGEVRLEMSKKQAKAQIETAKANYETTKWWVEQISFVIVNLLKGIDAIRQASGETSTLAKDFVDWGAKLVFDPAEVEAELNKTIAEQEAGLAQMNTDYWTFKNQLKEIDKRAQDERRRIQKETQEKEREAEKDHGEKMNAMGKDAKVLGEQQKTDIVLKAIADRHAQEEYEEDQKNKRLQEIQRQHMQNYVTIAGGGLRALGELVSAFNIKDEKRAKKQFQIMKSIQMASALIDTYKAITGALADTSPIPYYMKVANAAIAGATGFAQVAKIAQTQFNSPTTDGGGGLNGGTDGGGGGGMQAPPIDFSFMNQTGQPNTVETYVLAGNVANALEARQKIIDQSHL
jgi:DNA repair exonuclease SbcCD ATPase subunit